MKIVRDMKKIGLLLFGVMLAQGVKAVQTYTKGEWRIDSVVTTTSGGSFFSREICKYNDKGLLSEILGQEASGGDIFKSKTIFTYNDQGMTATQEMYSQSGTDWVLLSKSVVTEYDSSNGMPKVIESTGSADSQLLGGLTGGDVKSKTVITKWHGNQVEEEEVYMWMGGDWQKNATTVSTFNSADQMIKMVTTMSYMGYELTTEVAYEYDSHGTITKETTTSMGSSSVVTYAHEYDANNNLVKTTFDNRIINYYWSRGGGSSGLSRVKMSEGLSQWFDLSGRRFVGKPTKQGVYIRDGKKYIIK
jgi:hypothetical protein